MFVSHALEILSFKKLYVMNDLLSLLNKRFWMLNRTKFNSRFCLTTTTSADDDHVTQKRNWSALGLRGSWGKRSAGSGLAGLGSDLTGYPSSHYIIFSHDDFNSKL